MPSLLDPVIRRAWRMRNETGRIHYIAVFADGRTKRLIAKDGHWLYPILDSHLLALGYTGPAANDPEEDDDRSGATEVED